MRTRRRGKDTGGVLARQQGTAMVEFALLLPLLMLLFIGMVEFGRAVNYWIDTNHLANAAVRWAVVDTNPGAPDDTLQEYIREQANTEALRSGGSTSVPDAAAVSICFPDGTSGVGDPVQVRVSVDYNWIPFLDMLDASTTLSSAATMRLESLPNEYTADGGCS